MGNKTIISCLAAIFILGQAQAQEQAFTIEIQAKNTLPASNKVFVRYMQGNQLVLDSLSIQGASQSYTGRLLEPTLVTLFYAPEGGPFFGSKRREKLDKLNFYAAAGLTKVSFGERIEDAQVEGGELQAAYAHYQQHMQAHDRKLEALISNRSALYADKDANKEAILALQATIESDERAKDVAKEEFVLANPSSYFSLLAVKELAGYAIDVPRIEPLFASLSTALKADPIGQDLERRLALAKRLAVGQLAPDFTQPDRDGKLVRLSDFRGQYLLLDFWASWCGPCRAENPNLLKAYQKYKEQNFNILAVSLDRPGKKQDWLHAIEKDGLPWHHVSDLLGWKNEASTLYGIQAIPQNVLIDPAGKIVAKNLHGAELERILHELL